MRSCRVVASTPLIAWMLTAGRTPPTPPRSPPLPVLLAASTPTPPTDPAALPAITPFPLWSALTTIFYPHSSIFPCLSTEQPHRAVFLHFINTHCAGTQDSRTVVGRNSPSTPQLHINARSSITLKNERGMEFYRYRDIEIIFTIMDFLKTTDPAV